MDEAVLSLFRDYGVMGEIREVASGSGDEAVFAISPTDAATMHERDLTLALQTVLHRKVWITTEPFQP
jgi:hypothetical protein